MEFENKSSSEETKEVRHGVGDRNLYYKKWDNFTNESVAALVNWEY